MLQQNNNLVKIITIRIETVLNDFQYHPGFSLENNLSGCLCKWYSTGQVNTMDLVDRFSMKSL